MKLKMKDNTTIPIRKETQIEFNIVKNVFGMSSDTLLRFLIHSNEQAHKILKEVNKLKVTHLKDKTKL